VYVLRYAILVVFMYLVEIIKGWLTTILFKSDEQMKWNYYFISFFFN